MQLVERFRAEANDGRIVEILRWVPRSLLHGEPVARAREHAQSIYATLEGWRCHPIHDGTYTIVPSGVNVRRVA